MTKLGPHRVHELRVRGGNMKFRAMRLEVGNFSWGSEGQFRIFDFVLLDQSVLDEVPFALSYSCCSQDSYCGRCLQRLQQRVGAH